MHTAQTRRNQASAGRECPPVFWCVPCRSARPPSRSTARWVLAAGAQSLGGGSKSAPRTGGLGAANSAVDRDAIACRDAGGRHQNESSGTEQRVGFKMPGPTTGSALFTLHRRQVAMQAGRAVPRRTPAAARRCTGCPPSLAALGPQHLAYDARDLHSVTGGGVRQWERRPGAQLSVARGAQ